MRKLSPTQTMIGGKVIELNSDKAQYLHLSIDQIQELALQQKNGTLFGGSAGGGNRANGEEGGDDDHEHEHHCALRQAAEKRAPARRPSSKKSTSTPGARRNTLQAPDIIKEAVAHTNGHSASNGARSGRSSSTSRHSHPSPSRSSRGATPEVRRTSNSKPRIREKTLEKEDMLGTKTTEEEVVVIRMKKFSNSEAQQRSVNRLSGIVSRGRSQGEMKESEGESRMSKSRLKSRSPSPSLAFGSTSPRRVVRSPSLKKTREESERPAPASVRRSASLRAPAGVPSMIKRTGSVRRKQGSDVQGLKKETEKRGQDDKTEVDEQESGGSTKNKTIKVLTSNGVQESTETVSQSAEVEETVTEKVLGSTQVKDETKNASQSIVQKSGVHAQKSSKATLTKIETAKEGTKKGGAGSSTAKAIRPRGGIKSKEAPPAVAPKPSVPEQVTELY